MQFTILIIEDDPDINSLLANILHAADYQTICAYSASEANLLLEKEIPDLILLDLMLPGISGENFLKDLRDRQLSGLPVIVISAKSALCDKVSVLKNGADDYMTKPFEPEEVLARVEANLRRCSKKQPSASLISSIVCMELFRSSIVGILFWGVIWFAVPKVFLYLALKYDVFYPAAMWFPVNFFGINNMHVTMNECVTIWDTVPGTVRCICSGVIGILIFTAAGIITVRRKDLD